MTRFSREELFDLAAAYAIGATTPEENEAIETVVADWPELAEEIASFSEVTVALAQIAPVAPSPDVRARLLRRTRETPVVGTIPRVRWVPGLLAAAAIIAIVGLGAELARARNETSVVTAQLAHRETTLNTLLHAEKDLRVVHMKAADTVSGPGMQFFWNEKHRSGVAHAFRLPPAPSNHAYQLWLIAAGKPVSVKVFNSDPDGHALVEGLTLPTDSHGVTAAYLTVEPSGGSAGPTTTPILSGVVAASY